jgi:hypothetical protein
MKKHLFRCFFVLIGTASGFKPFNPEVMIPIKAGEGYRIVNQSLIVAFRG